MSLIKILPSIILVSTPFAAQALNIKGIEIDKPPNCTLLGELDRFKSIPLECIKKEPAWIQEISFLSSYSRFLFDQTKDGTLRSVSITNFLYSSALVALTEKYGPPKTTRLRTTTATGSEIVDHIHIWQDTSGQIMLQQHGNSINSPSITLSGHLYEKEIQEINRATKKRHLASHLHHIFASYPTTPREHHHRLHQRPLASRAAALRRQGAQVRALGMDHTISPASHSWSSFFLNGPRVSDDFITDRAPQESSERNGLGC